MKRSHLVYFFSMEQPGVFLLPPPPPPPPQLDGMLVHRRVLPPVVNFALKLTNSNIFRRNKLIISRSQLFFDSLSTSLSLVRDNCVPFFALSSPLTILLLPLNKNFTGTLAVIFCLSVNSFAKFHNYDCTLGTRGFFLRMADGNTSGNHARTNNRLITINYFLFQSILSIIKFH